MNCNLWMAIGGFLAFPAIWGIYALITGYVRLFDRVAALERHNEYDFKWNKENVDKLWSWHLNHEAQGK